MACLACLILFNFVPGAKESVLLSRGACGKSGFSAFTVSGKHDDVHAAVLGTSFRR